MEHYLLVCGGREEEGLCSGALLTGMWREGGGRTVQSRTGDGFSCGEETASSSNIFTSPSFIKHNTKVHNVLSFHRINLLKLLSFECF